MVEPLEDLVMKAANRLVNREMENETWEKGCAVNGLISTEQNRFSDHAREYVDRAIATQTADGVLNYDDPQSYLSDDEPRRAQSEPVILGHGVLEFLEQTDEQRYQDAATAQYEYLDESAKRTEEGGISFTTGSSELWVGSIYMNSPFLARYGEITDTPDAIDEAIRQIEIHEKYLRDPRSGLFRHSWREKPDSYIDSSFWARGNGWAAAGLADTLRYLPEDHSDRDSIASTFRELCSSVLARQEEQTGMWHNILDFPDSVLEASGTLQFTYAFNVGVELGILKDAYADAADQAMDTCKGLVDRDGNVRRVAVPPDKTAPLGVTSYGQGLFLMAAASM